VHHVGILYDQFMMHGQRNIKSGAYCFSNSKVKKEVPWVNYPKFVNEFTYCWLELQIFQELSKKDYTGLRQNLLMLHY